MRMKVTMCLALSLAYSMRGAVIIVYLLTLVIFVDFLLRGDSRSRKVRPETGIPSRET